MLDKLHPRFQYWENEHASDAHSQKLKTRTHRTNALIFILKGAEIMNMSVIVHWTLVFEQLKGWPQTATNNVITGLQHSTSDNTSFIISTA